MEVSIIVPVYNQALHLTECLNSLLRIKDLSVEIICVNDGSTDNSLEIIRKFQNNDKRIKVLDKENTGYGDSMNRGIESANGDYIFFVESDDWLVEGALNVLYRVARKFSADIVKGNYYIYNSQSNSNDIYENLYYFQYDDVIPEEKKEDLFFVAPSIWSALYKRNFLIENKILFLPTKGAAYQDTSFAFKVWAKARRCVCVQNPIIHYRQDSIGSSSNQKNKIFNICDEFREIERFMNENELRRLEPIYARVKYISYMWNVNRLDVYDKIKFLMVIREEYKRECYTGKLVKKYWNNADWTVIHRIIFDFDNYSARLLGKTANNEKGITLDLMKYITPIYIYGAGVYGKKLFRYFKERGIKITGFIVTDLEANSHMVENVPVISVYAADYDSLILLGVSAKYREAVIKKLKELRFNNYYNYELE